MKLSKKEKKVLDNFKKTLKERLRKDFLFIKLFGSKVKGKSKKNSDLDILVVTKKMNREIEDIIIEESLNVLDKYNIWLDLNLCSLAEYKKNVKEQWPFFLNIEMEGKVI